MPNRKFDWLEHIKEVERECKVAWVAFGALERRLESEPRALESENVKRADYRKAVENLEGTYLIRIFAAFEATLRSYHQATHRVRPRRKPDASALIDQIAGRKGRAMSMSVRQGAHDVREWRNVWAHEDPPEKQLVPMNLSEARSKLSHYLAYLPDNWN